MKQLKHTEKMTKPVKYTLGEGRLIVYKIEKLSDATYLHEKLEIDVSLYHSLIKIIDSVDLENTEGIYLFSNHRTKEGFVTTERVFEFFRSMESIDVSSATPCKQSRFAEALVPDSFNEGGIVFQAGRTLGGTTSGGKIIFKAKPCQK